MKRALDITKISSAFSGHVKEKVVELLIIELQHVC
jgi:hypothetical protein